MKTRPPVSRAGILVALKCVLVLAALSLTAMLEPVAAQATKAPAATPAKTYPPFDAKASASAIGVMVYPKNGQPIEQQQAEENECFAWAKTNTGIDP